MQNIQRSSVRRDIQNAFENRAAEANTEILTEVIDLRKRLAELKGMRSFADLKTSHHMARNSANVVRFLSNLGSTLAQKNEEELSELAQLQKREWGPSASLKVWDIPYLREKLIKQRFHLDDDEVSPYFPLDSVAEKIFGVYGEILGLEIVPIRGMRLWDERVKAYEIRNKADRKLLAYFYSDLYARTNKTVQTFVAPLRVGRLEGDELYLPVTAMVANYPASKDNQPTLLNFNEVKDLFHRFDYVLHQSVIAVPFAALSGFNIDWSFVSASAQMFENFCYLSEV